MPSTPTAATPLELPVRGFDPRACVDLDALLGRGPTRGRVGLALSGGGTRAAVAAVGILRALDAWGLLPHVRLTSAVSGAAWATLPYGYLPATFDEATFLGRYIADPRDLRPGSTPGRIGHLDPGDALHPFTRFGMTSAALAIEAVRARPRGVDSQMLWTRLVGEQVLGPWGLAAFDEADRPTSFFAADAEAVERLRAACPGLPETAHIARPGQRPLTLVQAALRVDGFDGQPTLAPVYFTPQYAGIIGADIGTLDGRPVGGGAIESLAFGGRWVSGPAERPVIELERPLSLAEVAGVASVFYADTLADRGVGFINPTSRYFAPGWKPPAGVEAQLADAGSAECTGVAGLLAFDGIDAIIAAVNPPSRLDSSDPDVVVDRQLAALFGYRAHDRKTGWRRYDEPGGGNPDYGHSQVFAADEFNPLIAELGARHRAGDAAVLARTHTVVDNPRFGVVGGRTVRVVWLLLAESPRWTSALIPPLRPALGPGFPNISTAFSALPAPAAQLLAHYSGWMLGRARSAVEALFEPG